MEFKENETNFQSNVRKNYKYMDVWYAGWLYKVAQYDYSLFRDIKFKNKHEQKENGNQFNSIQFPLRIYLCTYEHNLNSFIQNLDTVNNLITRSEIT